MVVDPIPEPMKARLVRDVTIPQATNVTNNIQKSHVGGRFELKQNIVQLLHTRGQFMGFPHEDPQVHLQTFSEISDTHTPLGVSSDYVWLTLFPFSLLEEARRWLKFEPPNSIITWDDLSRKFLIRFFQSRKTVKLKSEIPIFKQKPGENLYQA